jgi:hypothetical protein
MDPLTAIASLTNVAQLAHGIGISLITICTILQALKYQPEMNNRRLLRLKTIGDLLKDLEHNVIVYVQPDADLSFFDFLITMSQSVRHIEMYVKKLATAPEKGLKRRVATLKSLYHETKLKVYFKQLAADEQTLNSKINYLNLSHSIRAKSASTGSQDITQGSAL